VCVASEQLGQTSTQREAHKMDRNKSQRQQQQQQHQQFVSSLRLLPFSHLITKKIKKRPTTTTTTEKQQQQQPQWPQNEMGTK